MKDESRKYTSAMAEITFDDLGRIVTTTAFDIQKSLWQDYKYFKNEVSKDGFESNLEHRYARICLMLLFAHMEAVIENILRSTKFTEKDKKENSYSLFFIDKKTKEEKGKIVLINKILGLSYEMPERIRHLRNHLTHFGGMHITAEAQSNKRNMHKIILEDVTMELIEGFEVDLIKWLDESSEKVGTKRLPLDGIFDFLSEHCTSVETKEL